MKKIILLFCLLLTLRLFPENKDILQNIKYLDMLKGFNWENIEKNTNNYLKGYEILNELNTIINTINENKNIINRKTSNASLIKNNLNIQLVTNGHIKVDENIDIFIDYEELFYDRIKSLVYYNSTSKILMIFKNYYYLYFIDFSKDNPIHYKLLLNNQYFTGEEFGHRKYSLDELIKSVETHYYTSSIIKKNEVEMLYDKNDNSWKRYVVNPENEIMIFKPNIEFDLKYEMPLSLSFFGLPILRPKSANIYPLWVKYNRKYKTPVKTYEFLNELLSIPNFYEVWLERHTNWIHDIDRINLRPQTINLIKQTEESRKKFLDDFDRENIINLSKNSTIDINSTTDKNLTKEEKNSIILMNRMILEDTFSNLCPKKLELKYISEEIIGDVNDYIDLQTIKLLAKDNISDCIIIGKNQQVNDLVERKNNNDSDIAKVNKILNIKDKFKKTEIIILSTRSNSKNIYNPQKYIVLEEGAGSSRLKNELNFNKMSGGYYGNFAKLKNNLKLKYYFESLKKYFTNESKDEIFQLIYEKQLTSLYELSNYSNAKLLIDNKYYNISDYKDLVWIILRLQYEYLLINPDKNVDLESENWEIPILFVLVDQNVFTNYLLNYEN